MSPILRCEYCPETYGVGPYVGPAGDLIALCPVCGTAPRPDTIDLRETT